jgi:hypothetical protein
VTVKIETGNYCQHGADSNNKRRKAMAPFVMIVGCILGATIGGFFGGENWAVAGSFVGLLGLGLFDRLTDWSVSRWLSQ